MEGVKRCRLICVVERCVVQSPPSSCVSGRCSSATEGARLPDMSSPRLRHPWLPIGGLLNIEFEGVVGRAGRRPVPVLFLQATVRREGSLTQVMSCGKERHTQDSEGGYCPEPGPITRIQGAFIMAWRPDTVVSRLRVHAAARGTRVKRFESQVSRPAATRPNAGRRYAPCVLKAMSEVACACASPPPPHAEPEKQEFRA